MIKRRLLLALLAAVLVPVSVTAQESWPAYRGIADATKDLLGGSIQAMTASIPAIVARLNADVQKLLAQPDVRERLEKEGAELIPGPPDRLGALIETDLANWKRLIVEARLSFE